MDNRDEKMDRKNKNNMEKGMQGGKSMRPNSFIKVSGSLRAGEKNPLMKPAKKRM